MSKKVFNKSSIISGAVIAWLMINSSMIFQSNPVKSFEKLESNNTIYAKALNDHDCNSSEWHFVITQIKDESKAPSQINVKWNNSKSETVGIEKFTGKTAHYTTYSNLDALVIEAIASIYSGWDGEFNLSHGPCRRVQVTPTSKFANTPTATVTNTPSNTPTATVTKTPTNTSTPNATVNPTRLSESTPTVTSTESIVINSTATSTITPTTAETIFGENMPETGSTSIWAIASLITLISGLAMIIASRVKRNNNI